MSEQAQASRLVTFHLESWNDYVRDPACAELWTEHYAEIAGDKSLPMGPDSPFFAFCDANGMLQLLTARRAGVMIGYCILLVKPHPHYRSVLCGFEDSYFLTQSERMGWTGVRLIKESLKALRKRGVRRAYFMTKLKHDISRLFARLGAAECDRVWQFNLDEGAL